MDLINIVFFLVLIKAELVFSECDTYLKCVGSFFDTFYDDANDFDVNNTSVTVPEFENVGLDGVNLFNILSNVYDFLKDEVTNGFQFGPPTNIFHKPSNDTNIYVRTIIIKDFDNIKENVPTDDIKQNLNLTLTYLEPSKIEIIPVKANDSLKNENKAINNLQMDEYNKKIRENEIPDTEFDLNYDTDDNTTDYPIIDYVELYKDTTNEYIDIQVETTTLSNIATRDDFKHDNATTKNGEVSTLL